MSHAVYPVKWIQSTLGGNVTVGRRETERERERETVERSWNTENENRGARERCGNKHVARGVRPLGRVARQRRKQKEIERREGWHSYYVICIER